jgi:hypothetical protein
VDILYNISNCGNNLEIFLNGLNLIDNTLVGEYVYIDMKKGYRTPSWFRSKKQFKNRNPGKGNKGKGIGK